MDEKQTIIELGSKDTDLLYEVKKSFYLKTCYGPNVSVPVGSLVRLKEEMGTMMFYSGKAAPVVLGEIFIATQEFRWVLPDGTWAYVNIGDKIKLTREEGLTLLREKKIKEEGA